MDASTTSRLKAHYDAFSCKDGHRAICRMLLPDELEGKRVLDLECRSGKGVFQLADKVGEKGFVTGVDHSEEKVKNAESRASRCHWAGRNWREYASFLCAYMEDLSTVGIEDESFDIVFVNSVINVAYDVRQCLKEANRVLTREGCLHVMGVFADEAQDPIMQQESAQAGDVFGSALTMEEFESMALSCGFDSCTFSQTAPVLPTEESLEETGCPRFHEAVAKAVKL